MDPVEQWWARTDIEAKQWLREHNGAEDLPESVRAAITEAGGPGSGGLDDDAWQFIDLQSEAPD